MRGVSHAVEVLVLGLLVVVYKIPYSRCIFNTVVVVACVIFIHGFSRCRGYWIWVFCCLFVVRIYMFGWLSRATCSVVSTSMLGVSHAVQNEKKLWKFTHSDRWGIGARSTGGSVKDSIQQLYVEYSSCILARQDVIGVRPSYYCLSGATCILIDIHSSSSVGR